MARFVRWLVDYVIWFGFGFLGVWLMDGPLPDWGVLAAAMFACLMATIQERR